MKKKIILHCDLNYFYAAVEELHQPYTRSIPMAVGGDKDKRHGIILAKNTLAKKYGVQTGEPLWQAKQKCPNLVILPARFSLYMKFSKKVMDIYKRYTDLIEPFGIDEAWLDVSSCERLYGNGLAIAQKISQDIKQECGLTVSIGVSDNKIYAKLGSDYKKPDAITVLDESNVHEIIYPLPVEDLLYVGRATKHKLYRYGIKTIGDLANTPLQFLIDHFGKWGHVLHRFSNGLETSEVKHFSHHSIVKSIGNSITSKVDLNSLNDVKIVATVLCESVASRLKQHQLACRTISISMRDEELHTFTRQIGCEVPTDTSEDLIHYAMLLFTENFDFSKRYRSIGVRAEQLVNHEVAWQISMFTSIEHHLRSRIIDTTMDAIRGRFGHDSIQRGISLSNLSLSDFNPKEDHVIFPFAYFKESI
jgi:DNA polymerase IV